MFKKILAIYLLSSGSLYLYGQQPLGCVPEDVERIIQKYSSPEYLDGLKKYTSQEFIDSVVYPEKKRLEKLKAFNDRLITEIPLHKWFGDTVPRVGIYNKDILGLLCAGSKWGLDYFLYHKLRTYIVDQVTRRYVGARADLLMLLDACDTAATDDERVTREQALEGKLRQLADIQWDDLGQPQFVKLFTGYFAAVCIFDSLQHHWLFADQKYLGILGFLEQWAKNAEYGIVLGPEQPLALSQICDPAFVFQMPAGDTQTSVLQVVNNWLAQYGLDNDISRFLRGKAACFVRQLTMHLLFIVWFEHYMFSVLCAKKSVAHRKELAAVLRAYDPQNIKTRDALRDYVVNKSGSLGDLWLTLKTQKLVEWNLYYNVLVLVPSCCKIAYMAYKAYGAASSTVPAPVA